MRGGSRGIKVTTDDVIINATNDLLTVIGVEVLCERVFQGSKPVLRCEWGGKTYTTARPRGTDCDLTDALQIIAGRIQRDINIQRPKQKEMLRAWKEGKPMTQHEQKDVSAKTQLLIERGQGSLFDLEAVAP